MAAVASAEKDADQTRSLELNSQSKQLRKPHEGTDLKSKIDFLWVEWYESKLPSLGPCQAM
jgi:hypothetical protein